MGIITKIKNWNRLVRLVNKSRAEGKPEILILSTANELVIFPRKDLGDTTKKSLRLNYKGWTPKP